MTRVEAIDALLVKVKAGEWDHRPNSATRVVFPYKSASADDLGLTAISAFNGSVDAAIALCEAVLPEWGWRLQNMNIGTGAVAVVVHGDTLFEARHNDPARALLIAILEALKAQEEGE